MLCNSTSRLPKLNCWSFHGLRLFELGASIHGSHAYSTAATSFKVDANRRLGDLFRSGQVDEACKVFDKMPERDAFTWNTMVSGYANLGRLNEARGVFYETPTKSSITWNALISGFCKHGCESEALELFWQMRFDGFKPTDFTLGSVLGLCSKLGWLQLGKQLHSFVVKSGLDIDVSVVAGLVDMYAKCDCIDEAEYVFEAAPCKSSCILWTSMLTGYSSCGFGQRAMECLRFMLVEGINPNEFTFPVILTTCAAVLAMPFGRQVHGCTVKYGLVENVFVESALIDMYAKCRDLDSAVTVLENAQQADNAASWNSMIVGCAREGFHEKTLTLFKEMLTRKIRIDHHTYPSVMNCCASYIYIGSGNAESLHCLVIKTGFEDNNLVGNSLIDMYAKQHKIGYALKVFNAAPKKDVVSWTSLITGYMLNGMHGEALRLSAEMRTEGIIIRADEYLASSILSASAELTVCEFGKQVHSFSIKSGLGSSLSVNNSLINLYVRSGCIEDAKRLFDRMQVREVIAWTSLIVGYAQNGQGKYSIKVYEEMVASGVVPDSVTFVGLLFACSHAGLVQVGKSYFQAMFKVYGIKPGLEHFSCMIDLLARSGEMSDAEELLNLMPMNPGSNIWKSILAGCRVHHGNVCLAEKAARKLFELEPSNAVPYVSLANVYSAAGRWEDAGNIRRKMKLKLINKEPGYSWMEANGRVHTFTSEERNHAMTTEIYAKVDEIITLIKKAGYVPETSAALHDMDDEGKQRSLAHHSEKLAVAFGLLTSPLGAPLRIFKNIRVCVDCHVVMKYTSEVYHRHIILRDSNCFHHFRRGMCSCDDYW
ncbi:hypothetical protein Dimus_006492 [Dionaea muscipula]